MLTASNLPQVAIVQCRSQTTFKIKEVVEKHGFRSTVIGLEGLMNWLNQNPVQTVILSGGAMSVDDKDAPLPPKELFDLKRKDGRLMPIFGICFGMQAMAYLLGGEVKPGQPEHGRTNLRIIHHGSLLSEMPSEQVVWSNHGDRVVKVPPGFTAYAYTGQDVLAAMGDGTHEAVQFHPEVTHTKWGEKMIVNFLTKIAGCQANIQKSREGDAIRERIIEIVGDGQLVIPFSAGVDSSTMAAHVPKELKDRTHLVTVDCGNQRRGDVAFQKSIAKHLGLPWHLLDARDEVDEAFAHTINGEEKRKIFQGIYTRQIVAFRQRFKEGVTMGDGTNIADEIESGHRGGVHIKTHHNKGIPWKELGFKELTPLAHLFKHQVRLLGREAGLPESVYNRPPFPGPGNIPRVIGIPVTLQRLDIVAEKEEGTSLILERTGHLEMISQLVVGLWGINTTGQKGDSRVYGPVIAVRPVVSVDFMTADPYYLPRDIEEEIRAIATSTHGISRCIFDYNTKPPATIEWE
ncbi:MAG: gamma-glutamyl-gamma-aminobutyrate hydrolase family protein [Candidatus Moraniibacteriota bacterium]